MIKSVPNNKFPFITCYARLLDRRNFNEITEYKDALTYNDSWDLGIVKNEKGLSQYILEFDIWNNEPDVSLGSTQQLFNDAKDSKILIYSNRNKDPYNENVSFKIRNIITEVNEFENYNDGYTLFGNVTNEPGILKGNGDHAIIQIAVNVNDVIKDTNKLDFVLCLQYTDQEITNDVFFDFCINLSDINTNVTTTFIGDNSGITRGSINGMEINNAIIEAYDVKGKLKDHQILNSNNYNLFLNKGEYNFVIKNSLMMRRFNNVIVENGILPCFGEVVKGLICNMHDDVIEYYNGEDIITEVHGKLIDEYKNPIKNSQIIITSNNDLIVNYVTDNDGYYRFLLNPGVYDIRILSDNKRVKIIKNYEFLREDGLFSNIKNSLYKFEFDFGFTII